MKHIKIKIFDETVTLGSDGTIDRPTFTQDGYVCFSVKGERIALHRTIAQYFLNNGKPIDGLDVHHKDFSRDNNAADNLMILTKHQHIALHRYLETPEGYRKLNEDIEEWKEKADYYRKKAQKIEKLNNMLEKAMMEQTALLYKYKEVNEQLNNIYMESINKINSIADSKDDSSFIVSKNEAYKYGKICLEKFGKVTAKRLQSLGILNFKQVDNWCRVLKRKNK